MQDGAEMKRSASERSERPRQAQPFAFMEYLWHLEIHDKLGMDMVMKSIVLRWDALLRNDDPYRRSPA